MRRLLKFFLLPSSDRHIFAESAFWVILIRAGLWLMPFQTLRRGLTRFARTRNRIQATRFTSDQIVWAVKASGQYVPLASCLTQALAAQLLLQQNGYDATLCIGVALPSEGELEAHAWLECQGNVVIGASGLGHFTPLPSLNGVGI